VGQKVHPIGFRLGVYRGWDASWYARKPYGKQGYGKQVIEDMLIRQYLGKELKEAEVSRVVIEKASDNVRVIIFSGRPGIVIGKKGQDIENHRQRIAKLIGKQNVELSVQEEKTPEINAALVAQSIAEQVVRRISYKKAAKKAAVNALRAGAKGIKVCCSGRLNGAEIVFNPSATVAGLSRVTSASAGREVSAPSYPRPRAPCQPDDGADDQKRTHRTFDVIAGGAAQAELVRREEVHDAGCRHGDERGGDPHPHSHPEWPML